MSSKLDAALDLAAKGFRVFPLIANSKFPAIKRWTEKATADPQVIRTYWTSHPNDNIGILTGDGLIVLDEDNKAGKRGADSLFQLQLEHGDVPDTMVGLTPTGGKHHLLRSHADVRNSTQTIASGLDVRGYHGYIVAPGSTIDGVPYRWENGATAIARAPEWVEHLALRANPRLARNTSTPLTDLDHPQAIARATEYLKTTAPAIQGDAGDLTTLKTAMHLRDLAISEGTALDLMLDHYNERCQPPWDPEELQIKVGNAYRYGKNQPGIADPQADFGDVSAQVEVKESTSSGAKPDDGGPFPASSLCGKAPPRRWLVDQWLPAFATTALYGDGGANKTLLALQLAAAHATGGTWLGHVVPKGRALCVFCEDDKDEIWRRQDAIDAACGIDRADLVDLHLWPRTGLNNVLQTFDRDNVSELTSFYRRLDSVVKELQPSLLVLDTAADMFGGSENVRNQVNQFIKFCLGSFITKYRTTNLLIAHPSMSGLASGTGAGGSTGWNNSVRSRWYLEPDKERPDRRLLTRKKSNYSAAGDDQRIELRWHAGALERVEDTLSEMDDDRIISILKDVQAAFDEGKPLGGSLNSARPLVLWLMLEHGLNRSEANAWQQAWLVQGILSDSRCKRDSRKKGLKVDIWPAAGSGAPV